MDLAQLCQDLIDKNAKRTHHIKGLSGDIGRMHYSLGVKDTLRALQEAAVTDEQRIQLDALTQEARNETAGEAVIVSQQDPP